MDRKGSGGAGDGAQKSSKRSSGPGGGRSVGQWTSTNTSSRSRGGEGGGASSLHVPIGNPVGAGASNAKQPLKQTAPSASSRVGDSSVRNINLKNTRKSQEGHGKEHVAGGGRKSPKGGTGGPDGGSAIKRGGDGALMGRPGAGLLSQHPLPGSSRVGERAGLVGGYGPALSSQANDLDPKAINPKPSLDASYPNRESPSTSSRFEQRQGSNPWQGTPEPDLLNPMEEPISSPMPSHSNFFPPPPDMRQQKEQQQQQNLPRLSPIMKRKEFPTPTSDPKGGEKGGTWEDESKSAPDAPPPQAAPEAAAGQKSMRGRKTPPPPDRGHTLPSGRQHGQSPEGKRASYNDVGYDKHWMLVKDVPLDEVVSSGITQQYRCEAVRHHTGLNGWAGMLGGGIIGMYDTKEEAIKRAVCAAMFHHEFESGTSDPFTKIKAGSKASAAHAIASFQKKLAMKESGSVDADQKMAGDVPSADKSLSDDGARPGATPTLDTKAPPASRGSTDRPKSPKREGADMLRSSSDTPRTGADGGMTIAEAGTSPHPSEKESINEGAVDERTRPLDKKRRGKDAFGRPKACEMSDPVTREVLQTFRSCSQAERVTRISRAFIGKVCRQGGGVVEGKFFRFVYLSPKPSAAVATDDAAEKKAKSAERTADREQDTETEDGSDDDASASASKRPKLETKIGLGSARDEVTAQNDARFDISALLPLKLRHKATTSPKRIIELVDIATGDVVVCFRGNMDAAQALNEERKRITKACQSFGKQDEISCGNFRLRYADPTKQVLAYVYGDHDEDYRAIKETREERFARWKRVLEKDRRSRNVESQGDEDDQNDAAGDAVATKDAHPDLDGMGRRGFPKEVPISTLGGTTCMDGDTLVSLRKPSMNDADMTCVICQERKSQIVFEPCHHCVICATCSETSCKKFCPTCRTPIHSRLQPTFARLVRPRIYSAYSFM